MNITISLHVCSLEQSKILDSLGFIQQSQYYYNTFYNTSSAVPDKLLIELSSNNSENLNSDGDVKSYIVGHRWYSAYTVSELLIMNNENFTFFTEHLNMPAFFIAEHLINRAKENAFLVKNYNSNILN